MVLPGYEYFNRLWLRKVEFHFKYFTMLTMYMLVGESKFSWLCCKLLYLYVEIALNNEFRLLGFTSQSQDPRIVSSWPSVLPYSAYLQTVSALKVKLFMDMYLPTYTHTKWVATKPLRSLLITRLLYILYNSYYFLLYNNYLPIDLLKQKKYGGWRGGWGRGWEMSLQYKKLSSMLGFSILTYLLLRNPSQTSPTDFLLI